MIRWLPACLAAACLLAPTSTFAADHGWVGVTKCRSCHKKEAIGSQSKVWEESRHAKAFETLGEGEADW